MQTKRRNPMKIFFIEFFDLISYIVFVGGIVFFIRFFLINPFNVVWSSMYPTIEDGDFILVDKISQHLKEYERGDIVVFVPPWKTDPYVKRIIGLPGENITIRDNIVKICNQDAESCFDLNDDYLPEDTYTTASCWRDNFEVTDWYFVMGDNRAWSTDSRCCFWLQCFEHTNYLVPNDHIIWKVMIRLYPNFWSFSHPFK